MEQGEDKTLYLVSSLFILFAYKEISSHLSGKEHCKGKRLSLILEDVYDNALVRREKTL